MAGNEKKADISMTGNKGRKPSIDGKTLKRLMSYIVGRHKLTFFMVVVCILISSCTVVVSSLFLQILIDNYITPMLSEVIKDNNYAWMSVSCWCIINICIQQNDD